ncbi:TIGR03564 family F420-dependent LLM class oxidoreductase [Nocardia alni]|uniref:TIGR03564 family F420-dependent LLM class oxidoreductase n=1 Tax=Nocardia alni TaxID=2815723 RepID=UPI001C21CBFB|nr:TIGR03564 family F420-dependent LLM class oxidoreductase [Nocardia alni]
MRIGLTGMGASVDKIVGQAARAEEEGFTSLWYASTVAGDPLTAIAIAGRSTNRIELGTAVLQTYPCHPVLQANRVAAVVSAMNRPGFTLDIGPSHRALVEGVYGQSYDHPARNTQEYMHILTAALHGRDVDFQGRDWSAHCAGVVAPLAYPVPTLLAALSPRLLQIAGELADGAICWMATAKALESRIVPGVSGAAAAADRPAPRIVAGLPVAVHEDRDAAREAVAASSAVYSGMPNYQRILDAGGAATAADAAIVGTEHAVTQQLQALLDAGATDIWANIVPVGTDRAASARRTRELLRSLLTGP